MTTLFDEIREIGFRQAMIAKADDVVERMTAGMNINDIRAMLRGDEPRRPNPRLRPHTDSFWLHIRPAFYHAEVTHIYPTFRLGWLSTFMFIWETITGIFLMIFYTPSPDVAYENMWEIMSNVPLGQLMRDMHRLGAEVMVLVVALHMLRTYITGSYKKPRQFTWLTGMLLLVFTLVLSFSGYLLPWDQLAYWAVTVAVSAAESHPGPAFIGKNVNLLLRGAPVIGAGGLLRFYLLHVLLLPLLTGIFIFVHYYKVVIHGHSLPPGREAIGEDTAKRVPKDERVYFLPDIMTSEVMWTALTTLGLVGGSVFFYHAVIESHANSLITPLHVVAPWYLSWSQGWLKWIFPNPLASLGFGPDEFDSKKVVAFGIIPVLAVFFFIWPYLEVGRSRRYADRRAGLSLSMAFITFMLMSNWQGSPEFLVQATSELEVAQRIMPQEGHSILLEVPYDEWQVGTYVADEATIEAMVRQGNTHIAHALEEYIAALEDWSCTKTGAPGLSPCEPYQTDKGERYTNGVKSEVLVDPFAAVVVKQIQSNVRTITVEIVVDDSEDPRDFYFTKYRHEEAAYEIY
ncbi:MAG: cytochrome b N-terminal domain-containing protein [Chloroflexota bacterium]